MFPLTASSTIVPLSEMAPTIKSGGAETGAAVGVGVAEEIKLEFAGNVGFGAEVGVVVEIDKGWLTVTAPKVKITSIIATMLRIIAIGFAASFRAVYLSPQLFTSS